MHAQDGWHYFKAHSIIPFLSDSEEISDCRVIESLVADRLIKCTYRATHDGNLALRIYLIHSKFTNDDEVRGEIGSRKIFCQLIARITNNEEIWNGLEPTGERIALFPNFKAFLFSTYFWAFTYLNVALGWS